MTKRRYLNIMTRDNTPFQNRLAVYSPVDGQPCADHDRASGEGAKPQEYALVRMKVLQLPPELQVRSCGNAC